jgi:hypothetical protein
MPLLLKLGREYEKKEKNKTEIQKEERDLNNA